MPRIQGTLSKQKLSAARVKQFSTFSNASLQRAILGHVQLAEPSTAPAAGSMLRVRRALLSATVTPLHKIHRGKLASEMRTFRWRHSHHWNSWELTLIPKPTKMRAMSSAMVMAPLWDSLSLLFELQRDPYELLGTFQDETKGAPLRKGRKLSDRRGPDPRILSISLGEVAYPKGHVNMRDNILSPRSICEAKHL